MAWRALKSQGLFEMAGPRQEIRLRRRDQVVEKVSLVDVDEAFAPDFYEIGDALGGGAIS
jgi:hypothetical protein